MATPASLASLAPPKVTAAARPSFILSPPKSRFRFRRLRAAGDTTGRWTFLALSRPPLTAWGPPAIPTPPAAAPWRAESKRDRGTTRRPGPGGPGPWWSWMTARLSSGLSLPGSAPAAHGDSWPVSLPFRPSSRIWGGSQQGEVVGWPPPPPPTYRLAVFCYFLF